MNKDFLIELKKKESISAFCTSAVFNLLYCSFWLYVFSLFFPLQMKIHSKQNEPAVPLHRGTRMFLPPPPTKAAPHCCWLAPPPSAGRGCFSDLHFNHAPLPHSAISPLFLFLLIHLKRQISPERLRLLFFLFFS